MPTETWACSAIPAERGPAAAQLLGNTGPAGASRARLRSPGAAVAPPPPSALEVPPYFFDPCRR